MKKGFTLAEALITLVIIGVVAALVIPSVLKNYNDKKYNTARLKALKTFGEAGKMASVNGEINGQPTARAFVENVLSKYLKITKVCDNNKASECNFPEQIHTLDLSSQYNPRRSNNLKSWQHLYYHPFTVNGLTNLSDETVSIYVTTVDGFSAKIFYNPKCIRNSKENPNGTCTAKECAHAIGDAACMNVIYDMNGAKSPNHVGEDIGFVTVFWSGLKAISVAPGMIPYELNENYPNKTNPEASKYCAQLGTDKTPYSLPSVEELASLIINMYASSMPGNNFWSASHVAGSTNLMWYIHHYGDIYPVGMNSNYKAWCVRR